MIHVGAELQRVDTLEPVISVSISITTVACDNSGNALVSVILVSLPLRVLGEGFAYPRAGLYEVRSQWVCTSMKPGVTM